MTAIQLLLPRLVQGGENRLAVHENLRICLLAGEEPDHDLAGLKRIGSGIMN